MSAASSALPWPGPPPPDRESPTTKKGTAIWIDLDNSPHVPLFVPIIRHYREAGVDVVLTARDHSQTLELLDLAGLSDSCEVIGRHYGKGRIQKVRGLITRALQLARYVRRQNTTIGVAVSHGSRSMVLGARLLGLRVLTMYDYEHTETWIFNRFSTSVMVPEAISDEAIAALDVAPAKLVKYAGLKEELYISVFEPEDGFRAALLTELNLANEALPLVVLRPPANTANYHSERSDDLLRVVLSHLGDAAAVTLIVPRTKQQAAELTEIIGPETTNVRILPMAVDGLQLAYASDLLISGGGTMNREAALLGVPVYSIFAGRQGSLDAKMEAEGRIRFIRTEADVRSIRPVKRKRVDISLPDNAVERAVIEQIDRLLS